MKAFIVLCVVFIVGHCQAVDAGEICDISKVDRSYAIFKEEFEKYNACVKGNDDDKVEPNEDVTTMSEVEENNNSTDIDPTAAPVSESKSLESGRTNTVLVASRGRVWPAKRSKSSKGRVWPAKRSKSLKRKFM